VADGFILHAICARFRVARCVGLVLFVALASGCGETKVMTLPAAPADLFDPAAPVAVGREYAVGDRHGRIVAGGADGMGAGMLLGAGGAVRAGAETRDPYGLALGVLIAPVAAVGGGIYGAAAAHPETETAAAIAAIQAVYQDEEFLAGLGGTVAEQLAQERNGGRTPCAPQPYRVAASKILVGPARKDILCGQEAAANQLRLRVTYDFRTEGIYSPDLKFGIAVLGRAHRADRPETVHEYRWAYRSPTLDFFTMTANGAEQLRHAVRAAQNRMATRIVDDLVRLRHPTRLIGTYFAKAESGGFGPRHSRFMPRPHAEEEVVRLPIERELIDVPEAMLSNPAPDD
jgi:hypothetical protein